MTTLPEHIRALREALAAGPSSGPWRVDQDHRPGMRWNRHILRANGDAVCFMAHSDGLTPEADAATAALIAAAHPAAILAVLDALEAARLDAERYRFIRDADRSDCITPELGLYAMDSLDEYVDAAMEDEARNAAIDAALTNTGA